MRNRRFHASTCEDGGRDRRSYDRRRHVVGAMAAGWRIRLRRPERSDTDRGHVRRRGRRTHRLVRHPKRGNECLCPTCRRFGSSALDDGWGRGECGGERPRLPASRERRRRRCDRHVGRPAQQQLGHLCAALECVRRRAVGRQWHSRLRSRQRPALPADPRHGDEWSVHRMGGLPERYQHRLVWRARDQCRGPHVGPERKSHLHGSGRSDQSRSPHGRRERVLRGVGRLPEW